MDASKIVAEIYAQQEQADADKLAAPEHRKAYMLEVFNFWKAIEQCGDGDHTLSEYLQEQPADAEPALVLGGALCVRIQADKAQFGPRDCDTHFLPAEVACQRLASYLIGRGFDLRPVSTSSQISDAISTQEYKATKSGLVALASWALKRTESYHDPLTTTGILSRKVRAMMFKAGWRKQTEPDMPPKVREAILHVRSLFPIVSMVVFNEDTRWQFMGPDFQKVEFGHAPVSIGLLEDAQRSVPNFPAVYQLREDPTEG